MDMTLCYLQLRRIMLACMAALSITVLLLLAMNSLISMDVPDINTSTTVIDTTFLDPTPDIKPIPKEKIKPIVEPTDPPPIDFALAELPPIDDGNIINSNLGIDIGPPTFDGNSGSNNAVAMMQMAPMYPSRAKSRGIEGYVDLIFDINASGRTQNIRILDANPQGYFERASIRALKKWKYQPPMIDGKPTGKANLTTRISYALDN